MCLVVTAVDHPRKLRKECRAGSMTTEGTCRMGFHDVVRFVFVVTFGRPVSFDSLVPGWERKRYLD